jgi:transcriptional regulator with XRE-family HTH domain
VASEVRFYRPRPNARLLALLKARRMYLHEFAELMGCNPVTVWRRETGKAGIPGDWYARAAEVLGVSIDEVAPPPLEESAA